MAAPGFISAVRVIAMLTFASRILGLLRDMALTAVFGASGTLTAFVVAFRIPNLFRRLLGEGALSASFIPVFSRRFHKRGTQSAEQAAQQVIGLQVLVLAAVTVIGELVIAGLWLLDPDSSRNRLTLILAAIMLPHVISVCTTALLGGMLNVLRNFWIPTLAPIILNVFEVIGVIVAWSLHEQGRLPSIWPVVAGVMIASAIEVIIPWYALRRRGISIWPKIGWDDPAVKTVITLMIPTALGLAAVQVNAFLDTMIAMFMVPRVNGPLILELSQRLYQLPLGVFGISVATAIFEQMSAEAAHGRMADLRRTAGQGLRLMLFVGLPVSIGMIMLARPITEILFLRGKFTPEAAVLVSNTATLYMLGISAYMAQHVFARGFYALQRPQIPSRIAVYMVALNLTLNLLLVRFLHEAGLALSTAVTAYVQIAFLNRAWRQTTGGAALEGLARSLTRTGAATVAMWAAIVAARYLLGPAAGNMPHLLVSTAVGATVFFAAAWALGSEEMRLLMQGLRRRAKASSAATQEAQEQVSAK